VVFGNLLLTSKLHAKFEVTRFNSCRNKWGSQVFWMLPSPDPCQIWSKKRFLATYFSNPCSAPNLKLPDSTVAEISRGSQILDASLAQTPASFGTKSSFFIRYTQYVNPSYIPNLELLASLVAEININIL